MGMARNMMMRMTSMMNFEWAKAVVGKMWALRATERAKQKIPLLLS
jgi:hypothetical protein